MSRPNSSVPSQCAALGPCSVASRFCWTGEYRPITGASTASSSSAPVRPAPATKAGVRAARAPKDGRPAIGARASSVSGAPDPSPAATVLICAPPARRSPEPDPGVELGGGQVGQQVDDDDSDRVHDGDPLDD